MRRLPGTVYSETMRKSTKPWLEYEGQASSEILACKETHRIDSLLCALEWGIQAKAKPIGEDRLADEERVVLAVMALEREVNNGGYGQFFVNSSRRFAPIIVEALRTIGCEDVAAITARAVAASGAERDAALEACDQEFYKIGGIEDKLFRFVEEHPDIIRFDRGPAPPKRREIGLDIPNTTKLETRLQLAKIADTTLEGLRMAAREIARTDGIAATEAEIESAAALGALSSALKRDDLDAARELGPYAFQVSRDQITHCVVHKRWAEKLIEVGRFEEADSATRMYLEFLSARDRQELGARNRIIFWARLVKDQPKALPESLKFFWQIFPEIDLEHLPPPIRIVRK